MPDEGVDRETIAQARKTVRQLYGRDLEGKSSDDFCLAVHRNRRLVDAAAFGVESATAGGGGPLCRASSSSDHTSPHRRCAGHAICLAGQRSPKPWGPSRHLRGGEAPGHHSAAPGARARHPDIPLPANEPGLRRDRTPVDDGARPWSRGPRSTTDFPRLSPRSAGSTGPCVPGQDPTCLPMSAPK
jgi:hypothetical protein